LIFVKKSYHDTLVVLDDWTSIKYDQQVQ